MMIKTPDQTQSPNQTYLDDVRREASKILDNPDVWLTTPNERLGFQRPSDVVQEHGEDGAELVKQLLAAIGEGIFS